MVALPYFAQAQQGITISPTGPEPPHNNALFEVKGTDKGILLPRLNWDQVIAMTNNGITSLNAEGLMVYVVGGGTLEAPQGTGYYYLEPTSTTPVITDWKRMATGSSALWYEGVENDEIFFTGQTATGVGIGTDNPSNVAALDVSNFTDKGVLLPRVDISEIETGGNLESNSVLTMDGANDGLMVYVSTAGKQGIYFFNDDNDQWEKLVPQNEDGDWEILTTANPNLTFASGLASYSVPPSSNDGRFPLSIRKLGNGTVQIRGYLNADATDKTLFGLPTGYSPNANSRVQGPCMPDLINSASSSIPVAVYVYIDNNDFVAIKGTMDNDFYYFVDLEFQSSL